MIKKEYFLVFVIAGLAAAYALFSFLVFLTRGRSAVFLKRKLAIVVTIITLTGIINNVRPIGAQEAIPTPEVVALYAVMTPEATTTPEIVPEYGILTPEPGMLGDVNSDGQITIVDALKIAQYYVGIKPPDFNADVADVNRSGRIDIIDAMLVAQKYVGLIDEFPTAH
jgi:hypothetical protein